jgi:hypothetical protein
MATEYTPISPSPSNMKYEGEKVKGHNHAEELLQITCPKRSCGRKISLECPFCQSGGLVCDEESLRLVCPHCHYSLKELCCSCGFKIKSSYVGEKQKKLHQLRFNADGSKLIAIIVTLFLFGLGIWLIIRVLILGYV